MEFQRINWRPAHRTLLIIFGWIFLNLSFIFLQNKSHGIFIINRLHIKVTQDQKFKDLTGLYILGHLEINKIFFPVVNKNNE